MLVNFPPPPPGQPFWTQVLGTLRTAFAKVVSEDQAAYRVMLRSPNGTAYEITVDNSGTLSTAVQAGKGRV